MPLDVPAGSAGRGDGDARLDGDLIGVGLHGDLGGLAGVSRIKWSHGVAYQTEPDRPCLTCLTTCLDRGCDNFLYGFKGARLRLPPGAGRARAGIES